MTRSVYILKVLRLSDNYSFMECASYGYIYIEFDGSQEVLIIFNGIFNFFAEIKVEAKDEAS